MEWAQTARQAVARIPLFLWRHIRRGFRRTPGYVYLLALAVIGVVVFALLSWDWLRSEGAEGHPESGSTTIRNLGLLVGGLIAIWIAVWRSKVAERSLLNERYQQGAEMLGSRLLSVRLAGIYGLQRLAKENREEYHVQIMKLLCAFVRHPYIENAGSKMKTIRADIQTAMDAIVNCRTHDASLISIEEDDGESLLDLQGSSLKGLFLYHDSLFRVDLSDADLRKARLHGVDLHASFLWDTDLRRADISAANLSGATLFGAKLRHANLSNAYIAGTKFSDDGDTPAIGLTQEQLDQAVADQDTPPMLKGVIDAKTGKPLVWRGG